METVIKAVTTLVVAVVIGFLFSYPLMLLWNGCLVSAIDGVREISWLQTWGIAVLFHFLFK